MLSFAISLGMGLLIGHIRAVNRLRAIGRLHNDLIRPPPLVFLILKSSASAAFPGSLAGFQIVPPVIESKTINMVYKDLRVRHIH